MITEKIGIAHIKIVGDRRYQLLNELLRSNISIIEMTDAGDSITGDIELGKLKKLTKLCDKYNLQLEILSENGLVVKGKRYYKHYGLLAGVIFSLAVMFYLSNIVLHIRIIGADYKTRQEVNAVLEDFDIDVGTHFSQIDLHSLETALTDKTDDIAWAGIRVNGSELVINISQATPKPDITENRYPANIVAKRDAVITDFQIFCGNIDFMLGDGVAKGQILIAGEYIDRFGQLRYRYSQASITGRFTDTQTFFEPYETISKEINEGAEEMKFFRFFDTDINFFKKPPTGKFIEHEDIRYWNFLGVQLPVGITYKTYDSYEYKETVRNEEETRNAIKKDIEDYESNFLSDCEIIDKDVKYEKTDTGIRAVVTYVAEGEIGETQIILPKKS